MASHTTTTRGRSAAGCDRVTASRRETATSGAFLKLPDEVRQTDLAAALQALGFQDRLDLMDAVFEIVIDDHVFVIEVVAHLVGGLGHAAGDHLRAVLGAGVEAAF